MKYFFKIIDSKIKPGFLQKHESNDVLFNKWTKVLGRRNNELIVSDHRELCLIDPNGNSLWENTLTCPGIPNRAYISDDRLLVTTNSEDYHAWGILGPAILIDLTKGIFIRELSGKTGAALSHGRFLLGLQGYDVYDTWLYDSSGNLVQQWKSFGHYVVDANDDIRVIEQGRKSSTNANVVRLRLDGHIEKGAELKNSRASNPTTLKNGDILFENSGELIIVDVNLKEVGKLKLKSIAEKESWRFHSRLSLNQEIFRLDIVEQLVEPLRGYQTHEWVFELLPSTKDVNKFL